jgi:hypothetical protein
VEFTVTPTGTTGSREEEEMKNDIHFLKTWPEFFKATMEGVKPFEIRKNDREGGFKVGDILILQEWFPPPNFQGVYSGRYLARTVTYVFPGGRFGLAVDYVVMAVK